MTISNGLRRLATSLEDLEQSGVEVLDVATRDDGRDERMAVDVTLSVPLDESPTNATSEPASTDETDSPDDAAETATSSSAAFGERILDPLPVRRHAEIDADESRSPDPGETMESTSDGGASGGEPEPAASADETATGDTDVVACPIPDCESTFESEHGMKIHRTKVHRHRTDGSGAATPDYRDPERLREVYESCDSFTEMREALDTDVSAQTVRRQMIAHGIYEPATAGSDGLDSTAASADDDGAAAGEQAGTDDDVGDDTAGDDPDADEGSGDEANTRSAGAGSADTDPQAETETEDGAEPDLTGITLPEGVSVADLKATVADARRLYDVQQRFDLRRGEAMDLLEKYELLELVHGRVSAREDRADVDEEEITRRILEHVPASRAPSA